MLHNIVNIFVKPILRIIVISTHILILILLELLIEVLIHKHRNYQDNDP